MPMTSRMFRSLSLARFACVLTSQSKGGIRWGMGACDFRFYIMVKLRIVKIYKKGEKVNQLNRRNFDSQILRFSLNEIRSHSQNRPVCEDANA